MTSIGALLALIQETRDRQDAVTAALQKKGVLSPDEVDAELTKIHEQTEASLRELAQRFDSIAAKIQELYASSQRKPEKP